VENWDFYSSDDAPPRGKTTSSLDNRPMDRCFGLFTRVVRRPFGMRPFWDESSG